MHQNFKLRNNNNNMSDDSRESAFIFQWLSMTMQRFNAVAIQGTSAMCTPTDDDI